MEPVVPVVVAGVMLVGTVVVLGASLTGNGQALCDRLGGTYTPSAQREVCPGGSWANFFRSLPKPAPQFDTKEKT